MTTIRRTLAREGPRDESMAHQNISAGFSSSPYKDSSGNNMKDPYYFIMLGAFSFDMEQTKMAHRGELDATLALSCRSFRGINFGKKGRSNKSSQYVYVGTMQVEIKSSPI